MALPKRGLASLRNRLGSYLGHSSPFTPHRPALRSDQATHCHSNPSSDSRHSRSVTTLRGLRGPRDDWGLPAGSPLSRGLSSSADSHSGPGSEDGRRRAVLVWGNGDWGRLGLGSLDSRCFPAVLPGFPGRGGMRGEGEEGGDEPVQVACGGSHTLVRTASGQVYAMGLNQRGQLGVAAGELREGYSPIPLLVTPPSSPLAAVGVAWVAAGAHHSACIDRAGDVWVWGSNGSGQLGLGDGTGAAFEPRQLGVLKGTKIKDLALGSDHSLACTEDGILLSWGKSALGHGPAPLFARMSGRMGESSPRLVRSLQEDRVHVEAVAAGMLHSACLDSHGRLFAFGGNRFCQLGLGDERDRDSPTLVALPGRTESVACGGYHTLAVTSQGDVLAWGANEGGCLGAGRGQQRPSVVPEVIGGKLEKEFVGQAACGWKHSAALAGNKLFTWGWGGSMGSHATESQSSGGQLGLGNEFDHFEPTPVENSYVAHALVDAHSGFHPSSGIDDVLSSLRYEQVSCGFNHTAAIVSYSTST